MDVTISPNQLIHDSAVVLPGSLRRVLPWQQLPPPVLYKYYPPERLHVLTDCAVRFSQRQVFDDRLDLRPDVGSFGTEEEIRAFLYQDVVLRENPPWLKGAVIRHVKDTPGREEALIRSAQQWMTAPEEFGVFCLCENSRSQEMWNHYADGGKGFVVAFNTSNPTFALLREPGLLGRVEYSDEPITSFLSAYGAGSFFRKRNRFKFEGEWRSVRALRRFTKVIKPRHGPTVYLADFDPSCIAEILVLQECAVQWELRTLAAIDARYRHAPVKTIEVV